MNDRDGMNIFSESQKQWLNVETASDAKWVQSWLGLTGESGPPATTGAFPEVRHVSKASVRGASQTSRRARATRTVLRSMPRRTLSSTPHWKTANTQRST